MKNPEEKSLRLITSFRRNYDHHHHESDEIQALPAEIDALKSEIEKWILETELSRLEE